jgi:hypothetical protein
LKTGKLSWSLSLLACLFSAPLYAETSVWKVRQGENHLFIGGTIHVLAEADYPLPAEFNRAYQRAERLVLETDMQKLQSAEFQQVMMSELTYSDGRSLKSVLNAETYRALDQYCASRGIPMASLLHFKPGMVATLLTFFELQQLGLAGIGVDAYFGARAVKDQKKIGQLESVESQLAFLSSMGQGKEDEMIAYILEDMKNLPALMEEIKQTWRNGDMRALERVAVAPFKKDFPKVYESMMVERNNAWLPQIQAMLKTGEVELILVGVMHLAGEDGLLEQLSVRGYEVQKF